MHACNVRVKVQLPRETLSSETSRVGKIAFVARPINSRMLIVESANYGSLTLRCHRHRTPTRTKRTLPVNRVSRIAHKEGRRISSPRRIRSIENDLDQEGSALPFGDIAS